MIGDTFISSYSTITINVLGCFVYYIDIWTYEDKSSFAFLFKFRLVK